MRFGCLALVVGSMACGGLDNAPLRQDIVRGALSRATADGFVSLFGDSTSRIALLSDGTFELRNVPVGQLELLAVANKKEALRVPMTVMAGAVLELGTLSPRPGSFIELDLQSPDGLSLSSGVVTVDGVPYVEKTDADGDVDIGPLPSGCYQVTVGVPGVGSLTQPACAEEGEHTPLQLTLPSVDGSPGHEGCSKTGCLLDLQCQSNGRCTQ